MLKEKVFSETREYPSFTSYMRQDGVIHFVMKDIKDYSPDILSDQIQMLTEFSKGGKIAVMITIKKYNAPNQKTMQYAATEKKALKLVKAVAVIVNSFALRLGANLYIKFFKPNVPTKLFNSENNALKWLKKFN